MHTCATKVAVTSQWIFYGPRRDWIQTVLLSAGQTEHDGWNSGHCQANERSSSPQWYLDSLWPLGSHILVHPLDTSCIEFD